MASIPPGTDLNTTPAGMPPKGVIPNLINPHSDAYQYYAVAGICTGLMTFLVLMRLYVRFLVTRTQWWDDCEFLAP